MKTVTCDICGKVIRKEDETAAMLAGRPAPVSMELLGRIAWDLDVCPKCREVGARMDVRDIVLCAWKDAVRTGQFAVGEDAG